MISRANEDHEKDHNMDVYESIHTPVESYTSHLDPQKEDIHQIVSVDSNLLANEVKKNMFEFARLNENYMPEFESPRIYKYIPSSLQSYTIQYSLTEDKQHGLATSFTYPSLEIT
ncbi:hypothetical protein ACFE04_004618 [Oxalis oulophora]